MAKTPNRETAHPEQQMPVCGIIMPIAAMPPKYDASHWSDVRKVLEAAIHKAEMTSQIVSDSFEGDVIQQRIIHNLYNNPVVVCDVSGLNPNVMFELGMRITFKQPVIIITDDFATIPFDTKLIEHIGYPRDLHIHQTNEFIEKLAERITRLYEQKRNDTFKSFIEAFGTFDVLEPTTKVVGMEALILDRLNDIERNVLRAADRDIRRRDENLHFPPRHLTRTISLNFNMSKADKDAVLSIKKHLMIAWGKDTVSVDTNDEGEVKFLLTFPEVSDSEREQLTNRLLSTLPEHLISRLQYARWL